MKDMSIAFKLPVFRWQNELVICVFRQLTGRNECIHMVKTRRTQFLPHQLSRNIYQVSKQTENLIWNCLPSPSPPPRQPTKHQAFGQGSTKPGFIHRLEKFMTNVSAFCDYKCTALANHQYILRIPVIYWLQYRYNHISVSYQVCLYFCTVLYQILCGQLHGKSCKLLISAYRAFHKESSSFPPSKLLAGQSLQSNATESTKAKELCTVTLRYLQSTSVI